MGVLSNLQNGSTPSSGGGVLKRLKQKEIENEKQETIQQRDMFQNMTGMKTAIPMPTDAMVPVAGPPEPTNADLPGRDLPVVGPVLRALDKLEENPIRKKAGEIALELYTPGAGLGNINTLTQGAESLVSKALPKLGNSLGSKVARTAATEALVGAPLGSAQYLASGGTDLKEAAQQGGLGAVLGGVTGAAAPLVGKAVTGGLQAIKRGYNDALERMPKSGISGFKSALGQKTRIPDDPKNVMDVIDVGGKPQGPDKGSAWSRFYTNIVDEQAPLNRVGKEITGGKVPFEQDPAKVAWLSRGWKGKADTKLQYGFLDATGNKVGQSLEEALKPVKNRLNDLRELAVAQRSLEYGDAGLVSGVRKELAESTIAKYADDADLQKAYDGVKKYISDMNMDTLVKSGIWSKETLEKYAKEQPNYIPMFRVQEKGIRDGLQQASGKGFGNVKDPTKKRKGGNQPIVDPIESIIKQTYKNQALAERNSVMRSITNLADSNPENALVRKVEAADTQGVQKMLDDFINAPLENVDEELGKVLELFKPRAVNGKPNVFTVMKDGKAEQYEIIDDQLAKVIAGLGNEPSNPLINMIGSATGILKAGLVLAPDFVAKNLVRDQMSAFINSKYGFIPIWDTVSGLFSAIKKDSSFWKWMNSGGANGAWVSLERDYLQGQIRDLTKSNIKKMGNPVEVLRKLSEISEQGTRLGEFKRGLKKGASLPQAALASRDVTLDFSRIGAKTKSANKAIAFFNVAVQSMDKLVRQFKDRPVATPVKTTVAVTLPSVLLYFLNSDRPEYNELPQWERDTNWHVYIPGQDEPVRIPKPFELGVTAGTFFERLLRSLKDNDPKAFEGYAKQVVDGFSPSVIPTLLGPWIEAYANKDMFTKAPIVPKREENLLPKDQFGPYTSSIARKVGEKINTSPRVVENYITGYLGTLGRYGLQAADNAYKMATGDKTPERPDAGLAGVPVLRSFISKGLEGSSQSVDEFYKEKDRLTKKRTSALKVEGQKKFEDEKKYDLYGKIGEQISKLQGEVRAINNSMTMTPKEKRAKLEELNLQIINLARKAKGEQPITR